MGKARKTGRVCRPCAVRPVGGGGGGELDVAPSAKAMYMYLGPKKRSVDAIVVPETFVDDVTKLEMGCFYVDNAVEANIFSCCTQLKIPGSTLFAGAATAKMDEMQISAGIQPVDCKEVGYSNSTFSSKFPKRLLVTKNNLLKYNSHIHKYVYGRFLRDNEVLSAKVRNLKLKLRRDEMKVTMYDISEIPEAKKIEYASLKKKYEQICSEVDTILENIENQVKENIETKKLLNYEEYRKELQTWRTDLVFNPYEAEKSAIEEYGREFSVFKSKIEENRNSLSPDLFGDIVDIGHLDGSDDRNQPILEEPVISNDLAKLHAMSNSIEASLKASEFAKKARDAATAASQSVQAAMDKHGDDEALAVAKLAVLEAETAASEAQTASKSASDAATAAADAADIAAAKQAQADAEAARAAAEAAATKAETAQGGVVTAVMQLDASIAEAGISQAQQQAALARDAAVDSAAKARAAATAARQSVQAAVVEHDDDEALAGAELAASGAETAALEAETASKSATDAATAAADAEDLATAKKAQAEAEAARAAAEAAATKAETAQGGVVTAVNVAKARFEDAQIQRQKAEIIQAAKDAKEAALVSLSDALKAENVTADQPFMAEQAGQGNMFKSTTYTTAVKNARDAYEEVEKEYDKAKQASESAGNFYDQANEAESLKDAETAKDGAVAQAQIANDALKRAEKAQANVKLAREEAERAAQVDAKTPANILSTNPKRFFILYGTTLAFFKSVQSPLDRPNFVFDLISPEGVNPDVLLNTSEIRAFPLRMLTTDDADDWKDKILDYVRQNFKYEDDLESRFSNVFSNISAVFEKNYADDIQAKIEEVMPGLEGSQKQGILDQMQKLVKELQSENKSKYMPTETFEKAMKGYTKRTLSENYRDDPVPFLEKYEDTLRNVQNEFSTKINNWIVLKSKIPDEAADDIRTFINNETYNMKTAREGHDSAGSLTGQKTELARTDVEHWFGDDAGEKNFDLIKPLLQQFMDSQNKPPEEGGKRWPTRNETYSPGDDYINMYWPNDFQKENQFVSVVMQERKAVAFCWCEVSKNDDNTILIDKVWSPPNERFAHVGTNLTQFCLEEIYKVRKFDKIETQVIYKNMGALVFFMKKFNMQLCMGEDYIMAEKLYATKHPNMKVPNRDEIKKFINDVIVGQIVVANNKYLNKDLYKNLIVTESGTESLQADYILQANVSEQAQASGKMLTFAAEDVSKKRCDLLLKILHTNCNASPKTSEIKITVPRQTATRTYSASMGPTQRQNFLKVLKLFKVYFATTIAAVNNELYNVSSAGQTIQVNPLQEYEPSP